MSRSYISHFMVWFPRLVISSWFYNLIVLCAAQGILFPIAAVPWRPILSFACRFPIALLISTTINLSFIISDFETILDRFLGFLTFTWFMVFVGTIQQSFEMLLIFVVCESANNRTVRNIPLRCFPYCHMITGWHICRRKIFSFLVSKREYRLQHDWVVCVCVCVCVCVPFVNDVQVCALFFFSIIPSIRRMSEKFLP